MTIGSDGVYHKSYIDCGLGYDEDRSPDEVSSEFHCNRQKCYSTISWVQSTRKKEKHLGKFLNY